MIKTVFLFAFFIFTLSSFSQFVPNRGFELGNTEDDIEYWTISGNCGVIKRVKYKEFQGDSIFPQNGQYMLLFENPDGCENPDKTISTRYYTGNYVINRFYHVYNSYYVDSMNDLIRGRMTKFQNEDTQTDTAQNLTFQVLPGNIWFSPSYNIWRYSVSGTIEPIYADTCEIVFYFDPKRGFSKGSFALIDDLRTFGYAIGQGGGGTGLLFNDIKLINLYPNPFTDRLVVTTSLRGNYRLLDKLGREVYRSELRQSPHEFDLGNLSSGIYIFELTTGSGKKYNTKLLKQ